MSDPAESPAPRSEDAEGQGASGEAPPEPSRPETPMEDSRPEGTPAQAEPVPTRTAPPEPVAAAPARPEPATSAAARPPAPQHVTPPQANPTPPYLQQHPGPYYQGPPPPPRFLPPNPRWHRPGSVPKQAVVVMAVVVALFGAWAAFHSDGVGIGLALTGIAMVALPLAAGDRRDLVPRLPGAALVAALWSVAAIRDAGWVVFLCSAAAFLLTPLVLAPQRRFSGSLLTLCFGWLEGLSASFKWARRGRRRKDGRAPTTVRNLWVALVTAALLLVFGGLFAAADKTFAGLIAGMLPEMSPFEFFLRLVLAAVLFPLVLLWVYTAVAKPDYDSERDGEGRTVSRFELAVPLGALNLLFAAFIAVQLRVYLGGEDYVMETAGLTFAEYARRGFWQLSFVAALSLAVIAIAAWLAPKREKADRWTARVLLGGLCVLSMVVIASALLRMYTYFETYGLTRMRIWVFTVEIWLAVLFALVIVCCWKLRATWLPRAVLASGALALLGLAAVNPDGLIARYNIEHEHKLDLYYLEGLSADAVPALTALTESERACIIHAERGRWKDREPLAWNWGYQRAKEAAEGVKKPSGVHCYSTSSGADSYGLDQPEGDRPSATVDASTDTGTSDGAATVEGFFKEDTCASLDMTSADEMWGTDAKGGYGVEPDPSRTRGSVGEAYEESVSSGYLECAFYGRGTGYLVLSVDRYSEEFAKGFQNQEQGIDASNDYDVKELNDFDTGYTAVYDTPTYKEYKLTIAEGELILRASIIDGDTGDTASDVGIDLLGQLADRYAALA